MDQLHPVMAAALAPFVQLTPPKLPLAVTICRECNEHFGPGKQHYGHCIDHKAASWHKANDLAAMACQMKYQQGEQE